MKFIETLKKIEIIILGKRNQKSAKPTGHWQQYRKPKQSKTLKKFSK